MRLGRHGSGESSGDVRDGQRKESYKWKECLTHRRFVTHGGFPVDPYHGGGSVRLSGSDRCVLCPGEKIVVTTCLSDFRFCSFDRRCVG